MRVVTSPYLRLKRKTNHRYIFTNYLTDKIDIVTPGQYKLLKHLRTQTHVDTSAWPYLKEIEGKRLLDASRLWQYHSLRRAEIEVNSYCNWQCAYCPSATVKRSRRVMDMEHFHIILKKCMEYGSISTICLHVYSEPTIDSFFNERITEIARFGFHLELFTNASHLDNNKILLLKSLGNVKKVVCHYPSSCQRTFHQLTHSSDFYRSTTNIQNACRQGLPVHISVHAAKQEWAQENLQMQDLFPQAVISRIPVQDRAGTLIHPQYGNQINIRCSHLSGCFYFSQILYVSVDGLCFPCINDGLLLQYTYGNIYSTSIKDMMEGPKAVGLRSTIFGGRPAPNDFMCRRCVFMQRNLQEYETTWCTD